MKNILYQDNKSAMLLETMDIRVQASALIISTSDTSTLLIKRPKATLTLNVVQQTR